MRKYIPEMTPKQWHELKDLMEGLGENADELLAYAVDAACDADARNWNYLRKVLNSLVTDGVKTVEQARQRKKKTAGQPEEKSEEELDRVLAKWGGTL